MVVNSAAPTRWPSWWPNGLAGISKDGPFGSMPAWIDETKPAGETDQTSELGFASTAKDVVTLRKLQWVL